MAAARPPQQVQPPQQAHLAQRARQRRPLRFARSPQLLTQRRNSCKTFVPARTPFRNERKTWRPSRSEKGIRKASLKISSPQSPGKTIASPHWLNNPLWTAGDRRAPFGAIDYDAAKICSVAFTVHLFRRPQPIPHRAWLIPNKKKASSVDGAFLHS